MPNKNQTLNNNMKLVITLIVGVLMGAGVMQFLSDTPGSSNHAPSDSSLSEEKKPLYWVAPMDANYRRDKPGKSPMGMDLVPVYETTDEDVSAGTVTIAPHVVNNLGVRTAPVTIGHQPTAISTVGYIQYDEEQLVHIHPRVEGWIEKLFVIASGNPVEKGQPLYTLYSPQLVNAQEELLIALNRNNKALIAAAKDRLKALNLSDDFVEKLMTTRKVEQNITFYSKRSGVVDNLKIREGFFVKPGTTLMSIASLDNVWVEAQVFERDAANIKPGLEVSMTLDYKPGKVWSGTVDYVYPTLDEKTRSLRARLKFANPDHQLKPNMFANVVISLPNDGNGHVNNVNGLADGATHEMHGTQPSSNQTESIWVPKEAVIRTGKHNRIVVVMGEGQFKSVEVTLGRITDDLIEVLQGLNSDDEVVTSAQFLIDSESSKTSDFKRMEPDQTPLSVWMEGEVNTVMPDHRMVNITHGPVEAWGWPEMTMDFDVAQSVDIESLKAGQTLHFEVTKSSEGNYEVTGIHIMSEPQNETKAVSSATVNGQINSLDLQNSVINISRGPIEKWNRGPATMDFAIAPDAKHINISDFKAGDKIVFTFEIRDDFVITDISLARPKQDGPEMTDHSHH